MDGESENADFGLEEGVDPPCRFTVCNDLVEYRHNGNGDPARAAEVESSESIHEIYSQAAELSRPGLWKGIHFKHWQRHGFGESTKTRTWEWVNGAC